MNLNSGYIEVKSSGEIFAKKGSNSRTPYEHQKRAMENMDCINQSNSYSTLVVLPTGGGKTYAASMWLLKNAIDNKKKILWIAHRQMLLDQAAESFQKYAYTEVIPHISSFRFRIVSGASSHDRSININPKDNLIIASKDSIGRNLGSLDKWLKGESEVYLIIDEAHHSTAKTYRMEKDLPRKKFIINSLLASGLSIIAGSPKVGKSWLVLDWCVRIAKGEDVWNLHTDGGTTLYLSLEDDESRLQGRLTAITDEVPSNVHFVTDCSKLDEKLEDQIRNFVDEHMDTVLIIIDTFQLIRSANKDSSYSNDYQEVQKLKKLADELKIAILLVHHLRKQGDSDPINEISGTNGIAGCADALFVLKKGNRTQGNATLFCTGRDIEDREIELAFSKEDCTWKMTADSAENPNMLLPDEMNLLIDMMKAEKYFKGSNADFLERYNAFSGKNLSARILKRMMNKWKYDLNDNHVYFKSYKENNIRKVEIKYDFEIDNSDSEYVSYDKYDENIAV